MNGDGGFNHIMNLCFVVACIYMLELKSSEELLENKSGKRMLQKGLMLEFKKDMERVLLAVAQKPGGKKNWMDLTLLEFARIDLLEKNKSVRVEVLVEVDELLRMKHAKEADEEELKEFVKLLKFAREMPSHSKPAKSLWWTEEKIRHKIESLEEICRMELTDDVEAVVEASSSKMVKKWKVKK
ncbi:Ribonuclease II [Forsythia ovata]|uniref:Ribonuclease II n=1 Tax=Forsythia ovata TaxID=205694 RepID=A0ABD1SQ54_9LAMI